MKVVKVKVKIAGLYDGRYQILMPGKFVEVSDLTAERWLRDRIAEDPANPSASSILQPDSRRVNP